MAVQHNKWSQFEHEGHHYRVRTVDHGWSYARFQIQKQTNKTRRKYFIFGEFEFSEFYPSLSSKTGRS